MIKQTPKLDKAAKEWIRPALYFALYDCCDSMHEAERYEARFAALADDKAEVEDYVLTYLLDDYVTGIKELAEEQGETIDNWKEYLDGAPSKFPDIVVNYFDKQ